MLLNREARARLAKETVEILATGRYVTEGGAVRELRESLEHARTGTVDYPPGAPLAYEGERGFETTISSRPETTLAAAERLARAGRVPAALNFASAKNPGGGFLAGSRAQEESLALASGLYGCLEGRPMYEVHRTRDGDPMYTTYVIYSPLVPVFRDDEGRLLDEPFLCSFLSSPAPNAGVVLARDPGRAAEVRTALRERIGRVLTVAAIHEHRTLVLGAWGCGVFRNDPDEVAGLFDEALRGPFQGVFEEVLFAVPGRDDDRSRRAFVARFG